MNGYRYIEVRLTEWNDLFRLNQSFLEHFVFRGQGDATWPLETSLRRMIIGYHTEKISPERIELYEQQMLAEFKWKYPSYQTNVSLVPGEGDILEWLSLMQHYGTRTRLMDFTQSLFVALYMALYGADNSDFAIWGLNCDMIDPTLLKRHGLFNNSMYDAAEATFPKKPVIPWETTVQLYLFRPKICNERISRQQGLFVMPSAITKEFNAVLSEYCPMDSPIIVKIEDLIKQSNVPELASQNYGVIKFVIPNNMRYSYTRALEEMNISAETMFPGLAGLAQSVNRLRNEY